MKRRRACFRWPHLVGSFLLVMLLTPALLSGGQANPRSPLDNNLPGNAPRRATIVPVNPSDLDSLDPSFLAYLQDGFTLGGGFPASGSSIRDTYYAAMLAPLLNATALFNAGDIAAVLAQREASEGGFKEESEENATIGGTYQVLSTLDYLDRSLDATTNGSLLDFLASTRLDGAGFRESLVTNYTTPEIIHQALLAREWLQHGQETFTVDGESLCDYLLQSFYQASSQGGDRGLFKTRDHDTFASTYHALQVMARYDRLDADRVYRHNYDVTIDAGQLLSAGDASLLFTEDAETLQVNSTPTATGYQVNVTVEFSLDDLLILSREDKFRFDVILELSRQLDANASVLLFNNERQSWDPITDSDYLADATGIGLQQFLFYTPLVNISDYVTDGTTYNRAGRLKFFFNATENFTVAMDRFLYEYTIFDLETVEDQVANNFVGTRFDDFSLGENYYALKILEYLNATDRLSHADREFFVNFTLSWTREDGYFVEENDDPFSSIEANYHAYYILHALNNASRFPANLTAYLAGWQFPDGGFGSPHQLSIPMTYRVASLLNAQGALTPPLKSAIGRYLAACKEENIEFFDDRHAETGTFGDSYYASLLATLIGNTTLMAHLGNLSAVVIDSQTPSGNFADKDDIAEVYHAVQIIALAGRTSQIQYPAALRTYVQNLQTHYGGFLTNPQATTASVRATNYALLTAHAFDFLDGIQLREVDGYPGAINYLLNHQDPVSGGFAEDAQEYLATPTRDTPTVEVTARVSEALQRGQFLPDVNTTGLMNYVNARMAGINDLTPLMGEKPAFHEEVRRRTFLYAAHQTLTAVHLQLSVAVDDAVTFPGEVLTLWINVTDPWDPDYFVEGCNLTINQNGTTFECTDFLNGTYTCDLLPYAAAGSYHVRVSCLHGDYLGFVRDYVLVINTPFDLAQLAPLRVQDVWFETNYELRVPVLNDSSGAFAPGANVTLLDARGRSLGRLRENATGGYYYCTINQTSWWYADATYSLRLEKALYRTELVTIRVRWVPTSFFVLLLVLIGVAIAVPVAFLLLRQRRRQTLARQLARGRSLAPDKREIALAVLKQAAATTQAREAKARRKYKALETKLARVKEANSAHVSGVEEAITQAREALAKSETQAHAARDDLERALQTKPPEKPRKAPKTARTASPGKQATSGQQTAPKKQPTSGKQSPASNAAKKGKKRASSPKKGGKTVQKPAGAKEKANKKSRKGGNDQ